MIIRKSILLVTLFIIIVSLGCDTVENTSNNSSNNNNDNNQTGSNDWLIPENEVFDGGPGKDGIPALTLPNFTGIGGATYIKDDDLVLIISLNNEIRMYPHPILDWHEIINDKFGGKAFALTYCPLTGSGISWNRVVDGEETTFGVSGLLYNTNLIPYDRITGSNWSQMKLESVNGALISTMVETLPVFETSWATAKSTFPNAKVVSTNTGYSRSYGRYPYGSYKTNNSLLLFPVNHTDSRLAEKDRVLGVFGNNLTKAYRILDFQESRVVKDSFDNDDFLVYGDKNKNIITAFKITNNPSNLVFSKSNLDLPYIILDDKGNHYDVFGHSKEPGKDNLLPAKSFIAYWFAWAAFYPETDLYK